MIAPSPTPAIDESLGRALTSLRRMHCANHWVGELSSSALATAMSVAALHTVNADAYQQSVRTGRAWLVATQHADGGWGDAVVDATNVNATSLSTAALTLTLSPSAPSSEVAARDRALRCLEQQFGGFDMVGDPDRCTLSGPCRTVCALAGLMDWRNIKLLRPEIVLLPRRWRRTISTTFPAYLSIATLHSTRAAHVLNALPTYRTAVDSALNWLAAAQGPNGSFEESAFLTSLIVTCLITAGLRDLPWIQPAVAFIVDSQREDGSWPIDRDLETFDTDLAVFAFNEASVEVPESQGVTEWLLQQQFNQTCFATGAPAGGWGWAKPSGWPDADDTAYTLLALRTLGLPPETDALQQGARWLAWMQNSDGSWSTFVRGSRMPFDHDCPYVTGHALSALKAVGFLRHNAHRRERALAYLRRAQRPDGSFGSIWFRESTAGTASVLQALCDLGLPDSLMARRARDALIRNQNDDGGWGGIRGQASTAEETGWAVMALADCNDASVTRAVNLGVSWLVERQQSDGSWQPWPIGLYYSAMWYSDSMYALAVPAQALARARHRGCAPCGFA